MGKTKKKKVNKMVGMVSGLRKDQKQYILCEWGKQRSIDQEAMKSADLDFSQAVFHAVCIALHREYGFHKKRIFRVLETAWNLLDTEAEKFTQKDGWEKLHELSRDEAGVEVCLDDVGGGAEMTGKIKIRYSEK